MYPCRHCEEHTSSSTPSSEGPASSSRVRERSASSSPAPSSHGSTRSQFVTGHLSVWDEDGDEDEDVGVVQDVGVVHYSAPNKESTFSEILISAVKSTFSHSNHHKSIKELLWRSFLEICFSHI